MEMHSKMNGVQWSGLTLGIIGGFFIAFPTIIGVLAIKLITLLIMVIGFYGLTLSSLIKSRTTFIFSASLLMMSVYAFINPESILLILGIAFIMGGINGLITYMKRKSNKMVLSSVVLILLGVFSLLNAKAALATVMIIIGIVIIGLGILLIYQGKSMKPIKKTFFYKSYDTSDQEDFTPSKRIIINIDSDEVDEVDFKEI